MNSAYSFVNRVVKNVSHSFPTYYEEAVDKDEKLDTENDSCLIRNLRKYHTDKWVAEHPNEELRLPGWLPPEPSLRTQSESTVTPALAHSTHSPTSSLSSAPGSLRQNKSGLGDLWAETNGSNASIQSASAPRRTGFRLGSQRANHSSDTLPTRTQYPQAQEPSSAARPLPSQRAGSYQRREATPPSSSASLPLGGTDRLRAKFSGSRNTPSAGSTSSASYGRDDGSGGGGGGRHGDGGGDANPYAKETRDAYAANSATSPYVQAAGRPYTGASSPWVSGEETPPISSGEGSDIRRKGLPVGGGRVGLPNGPRLR